MTLASEAEEIVRELVKNLMLARADLHDAERRCGGYRKLIEGYLIMFPALLRLVPEDELPIRPDPRRRPERIPITEVDP